MSWFTKNPKKKLTDRESRKPRSNSNPKPYSPADSISTSWCSTDPKDLPEGFTVGSMSVPYPPPYLQQQSDPYGTHPRKNKRKLKNKKKAPKDQVDGRASPIVKQTPKAPASPLTKYFARVPVKKGISEDDDDDVFLEKRKDFAEKATRLQRSRSMDCSLDEIGKDVDDTTGTIRRRTSHESPTLTPEAYRSSHAANRKSYHGFRRSAISESPLDLQRKFSTINLHKTLHRPKSVENLVDVLRTGIEVNTLDSVTGDAPIHAIIKRKKKDRLEFLLSLLVYSDADVNLANKREKAPLHLAVEEGDEMCIKALIVFGANINQRGCNQFTPLDLTVHNAKMPKIEILLQDLGAKYGIDLVATFCKKVPRLYSFAEKMRPPKKGERLSANDNLSEFINRRSTKQLYQELELNINRRLSMSASIGGADDNTALIMQQRELALYNKTLRQSKRSLVTSFDVVGGSRLLFMDGGGIKGLSEIEVLMQIEERTKCKITDLFDWIIGTSTGGIIALALVYAKKSLKDIRQLFFLLKNRIFTKARYGFGYNTENLEEILKEYFDPDIKMSEITHPKVLVTAVNKATTNLELTFFNNCFGDDYSDYPVWKVARYTSAAPMFFSEMDDYVDGGVLCNNPTDSGLTAIQNFYRLRGMKLPIALVVSVGSGKYPAEKLGSVNAQEYLFFGIHWFNFSKALSRTQSLFSLLSNALVESEMVAENSRSRCEEQNIPFYRFSATLDDIVAAGETDNEKLFNMVLQTKSQTKQQGMDDLIELFHVVAAASKRISNSIEEEAEVQESPSASRESGQQSPAVFTGEKFAELNKDMQNSYPHPPEKTNNALPLLMEESQSMEMEDTSSPTTVDMTQEQDLEAQNPPTSEDQSTPKLEKGYQKVSTHENIEDENILTPFTAENQTPPMFNSEGQASSIAEDQSSPVTLESQEEQTDSQTLESAEQNPPIPESVEDQNLSTLESAEDQNFNLEKQTPPTPESSIDQKPLTLESAEDQSPPTPKSAEEQSPQTPESEDQNALTLESEDQNALTLESEDQSPTTPESEEQNTPTLESAEDQNLPTLELAEDQKFPTPESEDQNPLTLESTEDQNPPTMVSAENQNLPTLESAEEQSHTTLESLENHQPPTALDLKSTEDQNQVPLMKTQDPNPLILEMEESMSVRRVYDTPTSNSVADQRHPAKPKSHNLLTPGSVGDQSPLILEMEESMSVRRVYNPPKMEAKKGKSSLFSGAKERKTANTHSKPYKQYKLDTHQPKTEKESGKQKQYHKRLETLV